MSEKYDSREDTNRHINRVRDLLDLVISNFETRGVRHDESKLTEPEKSLFDEFTPKLQSSTYGSDEYKAFLAQMKIALDHHYTNNSHHPEHYANGIDGMSFFDLLEMLCDWKAATERHADGKIERSLDLNVKRFNISPQLEHILRNTIKEMNL